MRLPLTLPSPNIAKCQHALARRGLADAGNPAQAGIQVPLPLILSSPNITKCQDALARTGLAGAGNVIMSPRLPIPPSCPKLGDDLNRSPG